MKPSALRLQTAARVMFALAAQSRSSPYKSPPRRANQSEHDVAASLKMPRSPPMQFQPVSRSTHAVCTSGTLHIVPLLLTAHNLLIKIPVLALPLSHDSDPFLLNPGTRYGSFPALSQHHMYLNKAQRKARRAQMIFLCIATRCVLYVVCKCMLCVSSQTDLCRNLLPSSVLAFCLRYLCPSTSHNRKNMLASPKLLSLARLKEWNSCRVHSSCVPSRRLTTQK